jgi:hypothetical protein
MKMGELMVGNIGKNGNRGLELVQKLPPHSVNIVSNGYLSPAV